MLEVGKWVSGDVELVALGYEIQDVRVGLWGHSDVMLVGGLTAAEGDKKGTMGQRENATTPPGPTPHHSPPLGFVTISGTGMEHGCTPRVSPKGTAGPLGGHSVPRGVQNGSKMCAKGLAGSREEHDIPKGISVSPKISKHFQDVPKGFRRSQRGQRGPWGGSQCPQGPQEASEGAWRSSRGSGSPRGSKGGQ